MADAVPGMLTRDELARLVETGEIETVLTVFPDFYGRLMGKRMTGAFFVKSVGDHGMHACDYLLTTDMEMDPVQGYRFTSWDKGYGDMHAVVDWPTLRRAAWLDKTALVLCDLVGEPGGSQPPEAAAPIEVAPRRILQRQVARAAEMGYVARAGSEIEVYLFRDSYESARAKGYRNLEPLGSFIEDYYIFPGTREEPLVGAIVRGLAGSGVPVENSKGEWGPGQQEINLEFCDVVEQADRNILYKHVAREIADAQGLAVTFMAKWDENLAGSSMHQHLSLWDAAGDAKKSAFAGRERLGPVECSDVFRWFLGGWMKHASELAAFFAPSVNSYKRYQSASFAPTAVAWAADNRTVGFRVVGHGDSLRIESRMPGADANPYMAYAAALAAGLAGIRDRIDPPAHYEGNAYAATDLPRLPTSLRDAITLLEGSRLAREAFGEEVVEHYLQFLRTEQRKFDGAVTDWERARFFERV